MYMRLGFSIAAHIDPAILLVDEVLAVGDALFQNKCIRQMKEFQAAGGTVIFVSHAMALWRNCVSVCLARPRQTSHTRVIRRGGRTIMALVAEREQENSKRAIPRSGPSWRPSACVPRRSVCSKRSGLRAEVRDRVRASRRSWVLTVRAS
jgi:ABC-type sugar transport system ATPase subunit